MTYTPEQPHPAAAYYPAPVGAPPAPTDLTAMGVMAFATATLATILTCVDALLIGRAVRSGGDRTPGDVDWSVGVHYAGTVLTLVALIAAWVTGSIWLHRARKNAEVLAPDFHHARDANWAWGGWIVPIVGFWFPFQVVRDTQRAVAPVDTPTVIGWWWGLFVVTEIGWRISDRAETNALASGGDGAGVQAFSVLVAGLMVAALLGWGFVLRQVTSEQHERMYGAPAV